MKWRSHISIGQAIADRLQMPPGEKQAFLDGMVEPDRHKERIGNRRRSRRVGHHKPPRRVIMLHVWMARRSFLKNDNYQGCRHLGMALHYVQDRSTSKGLMGLSHDRRESAIADLDVPMEAVREGLRRYSPSPSFVSRSISLTRPKKDPGAALYQAAFRSAAISAAVMDLRKGSEFKRSYRAALRRHSLMFVPLAIGSLAIGLSLTVLWASPGPFLLSLVPVAVVAWMDRPYRRLSRLAAWHGLRRHL
ncbi:MAG: hypothetical protein A4E29_00531 [Methanomassiliicoccales archaeon PtaB.Bin134]|nr:MAG: hypothetical protein A4E29_00531 [Methanomassiliicoccales archaeon PtaB.Bin134]